jgi:maltose alpha-D-glucosyltransferase / alpha-amylase
MSGPVVEDLLWYREAVFYELRVRAFHDANGDGIGDFVGLTEKLDYLVGLGITALWLLPFYPSPLRDDGYDVADYTDVHPDVGTLADFAHFIQEAHRRGLRVVTELVLNHTSDQHGWFQRARRAPPGSRARDFYVWSDHPDRYPGARVLRPDLDQSNWKWDPVAKAHYWHRFHGHEPDLNFDHPPLEKAVFEIVDFWLSLGVDGLRLDGLPYLYEREGTSCENLPENCEFLRRLRKHVDGRFPGRMLLAEAPQWPEEAVRYLEGGDKCHVATHFPLMPRLFMAIHTEDRLPIVDVLKQTPALVDACQWALLLRNYDELALDLLSEEEREYLLRAYVKDSSMRVNLGMRRRLAPLVQNNRRKIELLNGLLFSLPGTPVVYYGDEIGMGDNVHLLDRNGVRTPMQWSPDRNAGFSSANPQRLCLPVIVDPEYHYEAVNVETQQANPSSLLSWMKRLIALRKRHPVFGRGTFQLLESSNPKVLAFVRESAEERVLVVANLSRFTQFVELDLGKYQGLVPIELFGQSELPAVGSAPYLLTPGPHAFLWFSLERAQHSTAVRSDAGAIPEIRVSGPWDHLVLGQDRSLLEEVLPAYLQRSSWRDEPLRGVRSAQVSAAWEIALGRDHAYLAIVDVEHFGDLFASYLLPLCRVARDAETDKGEIPARGDRIARVRDGRTGHMREGTLVDALATDRFRRTLCNLFARSRAVGASSARGYGVQRLSWFNASELRTSDLSARRLEPEATHTSVVLGERLLLKVLRRVSAGASPEVELGRFLTESARFPHVPRLAGWLEGKIGRDDVAILAVLREWTADGCNAAVCARQEIGRYFECALAQGGLESQPPALGSGVDCDPPADVAECIGEFWRRAQLLGRRTAELHLALAQDLRDPAFAPEPYSTLDQRSTYQSLRSLALRTLHYLQNCAPKLPAGAQREAAELRDAESRILARLDEFWRRPLGAARIRQHGDYRLERVIFTASDLWITDFAGESTRTLSDRRRKQSALRDVAGMIVSFQRTVSSMLLDRARSMGSGAEVEERLGLLHGAGETWHRWVSHAFVRAYLATAGDTPFVPGSRTELFLLLDVFLLERLLRDVLEELERRSEAIAIPLRALQELLRTMDGRTAPGAS